MAGQEQRQLEKKEIVFHSENRLHMIESHARTQIETVQLIHQVRV